MKRYLNCSRCGFCLTDCRQYQKDKDVMVTPKGILLTMLEAPEKLPQLREKCLKHCQKSCEGLKICPMSINLDDYLDGSLLDEKQ